MDAQQEHDLKMAQQPVKLEPGSHGGNEGVGKREDQVARRDLSHEVVVRVARLVGLAFGRPQVAPTKFVAERLVLVHPPVPHSL